ncbi:hypothetical protein DB30_02260 [Enhygromyxa salina]|uniref:Uncharacterized protein n=2 Tax=Enhygromyxa salina TaxID=215803 RepID=A0A0C1Z320_9BACT|nr:hypothetical protein DB30_02260 [Enhygromyxa salina]
MYCESVSDDIREYYVENYGQKRLTVLRPNLSRQLDVVIHQEELPSILGMYADREINGEKFEFTPEGVTASWCDSESSCVERSCASPTSTVHLPYDFATDSYEESVVQECGANQPK